MPDHSGPTNDEIASVLEEIASLLQDQGENPHRIRAYTLAADSIRSEEKSVANRFHKGGEEAIRSIRGVGEAISGLLAEYIEHGRSSTLEDLRSEVDPTEVFQQIPGVGEELAGRIVEELGIRSLEELELAAHDGRLEKLEGFGPDRVEAIKDILGQRLRYRRKKRKEPEDTPSKELLLQIDREYREKAEEGRLRTIAPKRFNPEGKAWLPVYETERDGWTFTVLFSNTAKAHEQGTTRDWVVIYYKKNGKEGQNTVITAKSGPHAGERVVAGRGR